MGLFGEPLKYMSWAEMAAQDRREARLRRSDRRDGGSRYDAYRAREDASFRRAENADTRWFRW